MAAGLLVIAVYGPRAGLAPPSKPRTPTRRTYAGSITFGIPGAVNLKVRPGCWLVETDDEGNRTAARRDERARLWAEVGDVLIVSDADVAAEGIAAVSITSIAQAGDVLHGVLVAGELSPTVREVHVQRRKVRP